LITTLSAATAEVVQAIEFSRDQRRLVRTRVQVHEEILFFDHPSGWNHVHKSMAWKKENPN